MRQYPIGYCLHGLGSEGLLNEHVLVGRARSAVLEEMVESDKNFMVSVGACQAGNSVDVGQCQHLTVF